MPEQDEIRRVAAEVLLQTITEGTESESLSWLRAKDLDHDDYKSISDVAANMFLAYVRDGTVKTVKQLREDGGGASNEEVTEALETVMKEGLSGAAGLGIRIGFAVAEKRMMEGHMGGRDE